MYFSERYCYKEISEKLNWETMTDRLRNRLWNIIYQLLEEEIIVVKAYSTINISDRIKTLWKDFLGKQIDNIEENAIQTDKGGTIKLYPFALKQTTVNEIKKDFLEFRWCEVYDLIEFLYHKFLEEKNREIYTKEVNRILSEEKAPYRFINGFITPLTNEEEIKELIKALNVPQDKYKPVKDQLGKALSILSDRENPNYADSIKDSIIALESLVQILLGEKGTLGELIMKLDVHPALKQGFSNIYGWTSDEGGIRHGKAEEPLESGLAEARYMLITTSAFINYLVAKEESEKGS